MSTACSPLPPIRSAAHTPTTCPGTGLPRVDTALLPWVTWPFTAAVFCPASGPPCGLASPTPASRHHLTSV